MNPPVFNPLKKTIETFKPHYVWPNPAFPFRVYYDGPECRIFIIENLGHNWNWLKEVYKNIRPNDYFFVYVGCYFSEYIAKNSSDMFDVLNLNRNQFFIMFNDENDKQVLSKYGFTGNIINQNCWLDWNMTFYNQDAKKIYDAVYVGRLISVKRHYLASKVDKLALVAGNAYGEVIKNIPNHVYKNDKQLTQSEVFQKINESKVGLILSAEEGACFASSEYLLCGCPVVSTKSKGGRDIWYDSYNSKIVEANVDAVVEGVKWFMNNPVDGNGIRTNHIKKSLTYRKLFIMKIEELFKKYGVQLDARDYFDENYFHKIRKSYNGKILMEKFK